MSCTLCILLLWFLGKSSALDFQIQISRKFSNSILVQNKFWIKNFVLIWWNPYVLICNSLANVHSWQRRFRVHQQLHSIDGLHIIYRVSFSFGSLGRTVEIPFDTVLTLWTMFLFVATKNMFTIQWFRSIHSSDGVFWLFYVHHLSRNSIAAIPLIGIVMNVNHLILVYHLHFGVNEIVSELSSTNVLLI